MKHFLSTFAITILMWSIASMTHAQNWSESIDFSATFETEGANNIRHGGEQKLEATYQPEISTSLTDDVSATALLRFRWDSYDTLEPNQPSQGNRSDASQRWFVNNNAEAEIRELYFDAYVGDSYLIAGKQQIVWGQADGLKVLDVANPQSFREFILDDFDNSRIPLWALNIEIPVSDESALQLIWIPDNTYHDIPETGSAYAFASSRLIRQVPINFTATVNEAQKPSNALQNSDVGARFSTFTNGWDVTFNYLYHYHDFPVLYRSVSGANITVTPKYKRTHLFGSGLSNAFGDYIFRSEIGYSTDSYHINQSLNSADGIEKTGDFSYILGLDYTGFKDMLISAQFFQSIMTSDPADVSRDQVENTVTFLANHRSVNETWVAEIQLLHSLNDEDGLIRPKITHEYISNLNMWIGMDIFYGNSNGIYGQFNEVDRAYIGLEWGL